MTTFHVAGVPAPQGSKNAYRRGNKVVLVESSKKVKPWRAAVANAATIAYLRTEPIDGPVSVEVEFILPRPKSLLKRVKHMVKRPDIDKLLRSTNDALTGIAYQDDSRIVSISAVKRYARPDEFPGAVIKVEEMVDDLL